MQIVVAVISENGFVGVEAITEIVFRYIFIGVFLSAVRNGQVVFIKAQLVLLFVLLLFLPVFL